MRAIYFLALAACAAPDDVSYGEVSSEISVATAVTSSCSTATVRGLSLQIAQEVDCMTTNSLVPFAASSRIKFASSAVLPYLHANARTHLRDAADQATLVVNSGYRTVAQQYLLYRWDLANRCGVKVAALPGRSNHESGRAIDLGNWSSRVGVMGAHHWAHDVPGDPVHFDHLSSPDNRGQDVRAFQRLWNRNHPTDKITVDGDYGPQTAARLKASPAKGFAKGASCKAAAHDSPLLAIDGPDRVAPNTRARYVVTLANLGDVAWPATARLVAGDPVLHDDSWTSPTEVTTIGLAIPAGDSGDVGFELTTPNVTEETQLSTTFTVRDGAVDLATFDLALTVTMNGDDNTTTDSDDDAEPEAADEDGVATGGCNTGRGGLGALLLVLAALLRRRPR